MKKLLDSLTPEKQLQFLSTKDKKDVDGKTAVQWAPATERKDIEKMLKQYKREADFDVNYGKLALWGWHQVIYIINIVLSSNHFRHSAEMSLKTN